MFNKKLIAVLATALMLSVPAHANWPTKPITIVVAANAGGGMDVAVRTLQTKFSEAIGQPVVILNKGGAGGIIGSDYVAKSAADGYTLLLTGTVAFGGVQNSKTISNIPFDIYRDFDHVTIIGTMPRAIAVSKKFPANTLAEVVQHAKANPGVVSFSATAGSVDELNANVFQIQNGITLNAIYYSNAAGRDKIIDIMSGRVNLMFETIPVIMPTIEHTQVLAAGSESRLKYLPTAPTFKELGIKGMISNTYYGIAVPANTPKEIVDKLNQALVKTINDPDVADKLASGGVTPLGSTPEVATKMVVDTARLITRLTEQVKKTNTK